LFVGFGTPSSYKFGEHPRQKPPRKLKYPLFSQYQALKISKLSIGINFRFGLAFASESPFL